MATCEERLIAAGFQRLDERDESWDLKPGTLGYIVRGGGSLIAFRMGQEAPVEAGFRLLGAHTDSPNLRVKPRPERCQHGYKSLLVEVYGGVLLATWTDRDLSLAGRIGLRDPEAADGVRTELIRVERPICRIPNLAIHLARDVNEKGSKLNPQDHMAPIWSLGTEQGEDEDSLKDFLASEIGCQKDEVLSWQLCLYDTQPSCVSGRNQEFIHAPRLDNLGCSHALLCALIESGEPLPKTTSVIALFDHEEIGSNTATGANSAFLRDVLERICGSQRTDFVRAARRSIQISCDMAHAVHPHRSERHDPAHQPQLNDGPVLKTNERWRYATCAQTAAWLRRLAAEEGLNLQDYNHRSDLRCGSTIGPIVASSLGMPSVEIGNPMLSMHSAREMAGSKDPELLVRLLKKALSAG